MYNFISFFMALIYMFLYLNGRPNICFSVNSFKRKSIFLKEGDLIYLAGMYYRLRNPVQISQIFKKMRHFNIQLTFLIERFNIAFTKNKHETSNSARQNNLYIWIRKGIELEALLIMFYEGLKIKIKVNVPFVKLI